MNEILDIEMIIKRQKYPLIYNLGIIIIIIILIFLYKTYYINKGIAKDNHLELLVKLDDIQYIYNNQEITIDNIIYDYTIVHITEDIYVDELYNNYKYVYLKIDQLNNLDNYVYEIKLIKENKKIIEHLKDYV